MYEYLGNDYPYVHPKKRFPANKWLLEICTITQLFICVSRLNDKIIARLSLEFFFKVFFGSWQNWSSHPFNWYSVLQNTDEESKAIHVCCINSHWSDVRNSSFFFWFDQHFSNLKLSLTIQPYPISCTLNQIRFTNFSRHPYNEHNEILQMFRMRWKNGSV